MDQNKTTNATKVSKALLALKKCQLVLESWQHTDETDRLKAAIVEDYVTEAVDIFEGHEKG